MRFPGRRTPQLLTVLVAISAVFVPGTGLRNAHAAEGGGTAADDTITADVRDGAHRESTTCRWRPVTAVDPQSGSTLEQPVTRTADGTKETLYQRSCNGPDGGDSWYQWVRDTTSQRVVDRAGATATEKVTQLLFRTAPPAGMNVVNVGTWFWVPKAVWKPVSATAHVVLPYGVFSVTVTATPSRLRFDPGDGSDAVWCRGPGRPWTTRLGDRARSDCMHTYRHSSDNRPRGRYAAHTAVEWTVKVTSNFGLSFPLPPLRTGLPTPVTVRELQAVLSS